MGREHGKEKMYGKGLEKGEDKVSLQGRDFSKGMRVDGEGREA